jgi:hypothetical protein
MKPIPQKSTGPGLIPQAPEAYPAIADIPAELGVPLTQRGMPDLRGFVPNRFIPQAESRARGWSMFWEGAACRFGHQASRSLSNPNICTDCVRIKEGKPGLYPTSRAQEFREHVRKDPSAPAAVIQAPTPPVSPEPSAADQKFLAKLDDGQR